MAVIKKPCSSQLWDLFLILTTVALLGTNYIGPCEGYYEDGLLNETYERSVNRSHEVVFTFNFAEVPDNVTIKIFSKIVSGPSSLESMDKTHLNPLMITVRQQFAVTSWQLPVTWNNDTGFIIQSFDTMEKTLCFSPLIPHDKYIQVVVFTRNANNLTFQLNVTAHMDFVIEDGVTYEAHVSPVSSQFYYYKFTNPKDDYAIIKISSEDSICMKVSIQPPTCPVFNTNSEFPAGMKGFWETVSQRAGVTVRRSDFPSGFFLVFVVQKDDQRCSEYQGIVPNGDSDGDTSFRRVLNRNPSSRAVQPSSDLRHKDVRFELSPHEDDSSYWKPVLIPLIFYFVLTVTVFVVFIYFHHAMRKIVLRAFTPTSSTDLLDTTTNSSTTTISESKGKRVKSPLKIYELIKMDITRLEEKSKRYCWSIIVIAIFYCLPVIQLTWIYVRVMLRTGDQDLCYYNFLCSRPWGVLPVFNHVYSNAGYVILGIVFIILVRIKQCHLKLLVDKFADDRHDGPVSVLADDNSNTGNGNGDTLSASSKGRVITFGKSTVIQTTDVDSLKREQSWHEKLIPTIKNSRDCGIFYHFGLFYAMGLALLMEGVMSAAYHICPTQLNFQFDTAFMYVIALLCIVKLYQFRHPVYMNANIIFISLAVVAIWVFFGLWSNGSTTVRVLFVIFHFFSVFNCLIFQYYVGYLRVNKQVTTSLVEVYKYFFSKLKHFVTNKGDLKTFRRQTVVQCPNGELRKYDFAVSRHRAILPGLAVFSNLLITIVNFTILADDNFATQVLGILCINLLTYTIYYAIMKYLHSEYQNKMWIQTLFYAILLLALGAPSMKYFTTNLSSWDRSPAASRSQNQECFIMDFYDFHDFWHFLSAGAMFSWFMILLTIDDDLIGSHKSEIPVF